MNIKDVPLFISIVSIPLNIYGMYQNRSSINRNKRYVINSMYILLFVLFLMWLHLSNKNQTNGKIYFILLLCLFLIILIQIINNLWKDK